MLLRMSLLGSEGNWGEGMLFHTNDELMQSKENVGILLTVAS